MRIQIDKSGMEEKLFHLPEQILEAIKFADFSNIRIDREIRNIVVAGMGGSAIAGDILKAVFWHTGAIPVEIVRYYSLPRFIDSHTLLIVVSYSGNTEETLSCFHQGEKRGAKIFCISSGGELTEIAKEKSIPIVQIPKEFPPRCAIGYLTVPMLLPLKGLGIDLLPDIDETVTVLKDLRSKLCAAIEDNQAKRIAQSLLDKVPVIYSSYEYGVVCFRWRTQLNENSKVWAHTNLLPELNHNEIVGIGVPAELCSKCFVVFLRDPDELVEIKRRAELTKEIISPLVSGTIDVWAKGRSTLAKLFSLIYYGDWVSFHLAMERGVDPTPIERIDYLKSQLSLGSRNETSKLR